MKSLSLIATGLLSLVAPCEAVLGRYVMVEKLGDYLQLSQVAVFNRRGENIAKGVDCVASPGWRWNDRTSTCSMALDGFQGVRGDPDDYYHSSQRAYNFWKADLGSEIDIDQIHVYNRDPDNCCASRLDGATLYVYDRNGLAVYMRSLTGDGIQKFRPHGVRTVRISQTGNYLQLGQVAVYDTLDVNVAEGQSCSASTGYLWGRGRSQCGWALDGDLSTKGGSDYYYHSLSNTNPSWQVDLGQDTEVEMVMVYNRKDSCCSSRLNGATIEMLTHDGSLVYKTTLDSSQEQLIEPIVYVGCYRDSSTRDLSEEVLKDSSGMTVEKCSAHCNSKGYEYFGVQYSKECRCGNSYGTYGTSTSCTRKCTGSDQICGGSWANSVYRTYGIDMTAVVEAAPTCNTACKVVKVACKVAFSGDMETTCLKFAPYVSGAISNFKDVKSVVSAIIDVVRQDSNDISLGDALDFILNGVSLQSGTLAQKLDTFFQGIKEYVENVVNWVKQVVSDAIDTAKAAINAILLAIERLAISMTGGLSGRTSVEECYMCQDEFEIISELLGIDDPCVQGITASMYATYNAYYMASPTSFATSGYSTLEYSRCAAYKVFYCQMGTTCASWTDLN